MDILLKENNHWANFDTKEFPCVKVTLKNSIKNDEDFQNFLDSWEKLYERQRYFTLYFDTTDVGFVSMKYAIRMSSFIKRLKSDYPRLLQRSFIKVRSGWVKFLLRTIFFLEKPVADVYVFKSSDVEDIRENIEKDQKLDRDVSVFKA